MAKFLGPTGLTVLWSRIKAWVKRYAYITSSTSGGITTNTITIDSKSVIVPSKTSDLNNDAGFITGADIPEGAAASSATPLMDGTASAGTSNAFARGDHRHPTDTTRQATITGGASTITSTNLTVSRALISNTSGKVAVSDVTSTELGYLDGVTSNVQTQLDNKANKPSGTITAGHVATLDANGNLVDSGFLGTNIGKEYKVDSSGSTPVIRDSSNNIVNSYSAITADDWLVDTSNNVIYRCFGIETNKLYFRGIGHDGEHVGGYEINTSNNGLALLPDPEYLQPGDLKTVNGNSLEGTGDIIVGGKTYSVTYSGGEFEIYDSDNVLVSDPFSVLTPEDVLIYTYNSKKYYYHCAENGSTSKLYTTNRVPGDETGGINISSQNEIAGEQYSPPVEGISYSNNTIKYYSTDGSNINVVTASQIVTDGGGLTSSNVGQANGIASLDANGKVPSSQLPSYVDDVVEAYIVSGQTALSSTWLATGSASGTAITPEAGVIYIIMNGNSTYPTNSEYRWSGSTYVQLYDGGCTEMTESEMNIAVMGSDTSTWT